MLANDNGAGGGGGGTTACCGRCQIPLKVATQRDPQATMLRLATEPKGLCANCAVTEWLIVANRSGMIPEIEPQHFLAVPVQEQFARLMRTAHADMNPAEINWKWVVDHWHLPFPGLPAKGLPKAPRRRKGARA